jgi:segregation and condensation protein B
MEKATEFDAIVLDVLYQRFIFAYVPQLMISKLVPTPTPTPQSQQQSQQQQQLSPPTWTTVIDTMPPLMTLQPSVASTHGFVVAHILSAVQQGRTCMVRSYRNMQLGIRILEAPTGPSSSSTPLSGTIPVFKTLATNTNTTGNNNSNSNKSSAISRQLHWYICDRLRNMEETMDAYGYLPFHSADHFRIVDRREEQTSKDSRIRDVGGSAPIQTAFSFFVVYDIFYRHRDKFRLSSMVKDLKEFVYPRLLNPTRQWPTVEEQVSQSQATLARATVTTIKKQLIAMLAKRKNDFERILMHLVDPTKFLHALNRLSSSSSFASSPLPNNVQKALAIVRASSSLLYRSEREAVKTIVDHFFAPSLSSSSSSKRKHRGGGGDDDETTDEEDEEENSEIEEGNDEQEQDEEQDEDDGEGESDEDFKAPSKRATKRTGKADSTLEEWKPVLDLLDLDKARVFLRWKKLFDFLKSKGLVKRFAKLEGVTTAVATTIRSRPNRKVSSRRYICEFVQMLFAKHGFLYSS